MKKGESSFDTILDYGELMKRAGVGIAANMGKIIALTVSLIMLAVTFTDVAFTGILTEEFASSLLLLLTSSYIIYFSLEDAGERCGETTEEYKDATERYRALRERITGEDIEPMRNFITEYSKGELEFRVKSALIAHGLTDKMLTDYVAGARFGGKSDRALKKISRLRPSRITTSSILCREKYSRRSELEDPERRKIFSMLLKLIPSTVCMTVTVSVILTAKEGLTASDVLNGLLKLSALPMIGFKGYSAGYSFAKHTGSLWIETKANLIEAYIKKRESEKNSSINSIPDSATTDGG